MGHGMMGENPKFSNADIMFVQMMIPHHQQAVEMGTLAETRAQNPEVRALAAQSKSEQIPEILQMQGWLKSAGVGMNMGHDMGMNGMLSAADMVGLEKSQGISFDRLFAQAMIAHHKGAINMAQIVTNSNNPDVKTLAESIVSSQTKQIVELSSILENLK